MLETTENTTQSPSIVIKLNILQKRDQALQSIESYYKSQGRRRTVKAKLKANIKILFLELRTVLVRFKEWSKIDCEGVNSFKDLVILVNSQNIEKVIKGFEAIDVILDKKKLITWDNRKPIDVFNIESENKANHV